MTSDGTALGDRMKAYEAATGNILPRYLPYIIRVDVRAAHSLLRHADKPFDMRFVEGMGYVAEALCRDVQGAVLAYQQSDEVSVLACSYSDYATQPWFGGRVQKIASISAALATHAMAIHRYPRELGLATFDGRVFALPNVVEVANYFVWRQRDAMRNAVSMAASANFSPAALHGRTREQRVEMLRNTGIEFDDYPDMVRTGALCWRPAGGDDWVTHAAPIFSARSDEWLARKIPPMPSFEEESNAPDPAAVQRAVQEHFPAEVQRDLARDRHFLPPRQSND